MKALKRLIQLRQQKVDEQQQFLSGLFQRLHQLELEIQMIRQHLKSEQAVALESIDGTLAYVKYAAELQIRLERLEILHRESLTQYEKEQQKLQDLFGEVKVLEIHQTDQQKKKAKKHALKEQAFLDELYTRQRQT